MADEIRHPPSPKAAVVNRKQLTPEQDARRRRRLRSANGIGNWFTYRLYRGTVVLLGRILMQGEMLYKDRLPQPSPGFYPSFYHRYGSEPVSDYPFVLSANHSHLLDIPLTGQIRRPMAWPAKPGFVKFRWLAAINQRQGCVSFMRDTDWAEHPEYAEFTYTKDELKEVNHAALLRGQPVVVFPQGTRREDDNLDESKLGAMYAAIRANVPLVPLAIYGLTKTDQHFRTPFLKRIRAVAIVMDPIYPGDFVHLGDDRAIAYAMFDAWKQAIERGRTQGRDYLMGPDVYF